MDSKETLINFLRNVSLALENEKISDHEIEIIKDFYLNYNMKILDKDENALKKYLAYGWYLESLMTPRKGR